MVSTPPPAASTRVRILEAARDLVQERGADRVTMADVASAAGISRRALYLHFASRTDLLIALVDWIDQSDGIENLVENIWAATSAADSLDRVIDLVATYTPQIQRVAQAIDGVRWRDPAAAAAWDDRMARRHSWCVQVVQRLQEEGSLAAGWSPADAADLLWAMTASRVWRDLVVERGWSSEAYATHLKRVVHTALVAP